MATVCIHAAAHPSPTRAPLTRTPSPRAGVSLLFALWLQRRFMKSKQVIGTIPAADLAQMTALGSLDLSYNLLTGPLPIEVALLTVLTKLEVSGNKLTGPVPTEVGVLTVLTQLKLQSNQFNGTIPTQIGLLTALQNIFLKNNQLSGPLPAEFGLLSPKLIYLDLGNNQLSGPLPTEFGLLSTKLTTMYVHHCRTAARRPFLRDAKHSPRFSRPHLHLSSPRSSRLQVFKLQPADRADSD